MSKYTRTDREKAIERIKKCLRMAESSEPHEAAAAMRQAQKLMEAMQLTPEDVEMSETVSEVIKTKEAFGGCPYLSRLSCIIGLAFGVAVYWEPGAGISRVRANVRYIGPRGRVPLAAYAHRVIDRAVRTAWAETLAENPTLVQRPLARQSFRMAFLGQVEDKVYKIAPSEDEGRNAKAYADRIYKSVTMDDGKDRQIRSIDKDAYYAGMDKAEGFNLNRPMGDDTKPRSIEHER